jgi:hypothetical protein
MSLLVLLAVSFTASPALAPQSAAFTCVATGEASPSCGASPLVVAGGKGVVAARPHKVRVVSSDAVCHSDPSKGRACRHHKLQAENAPADKALGVREALR